jgi:hypothetical protein
MGKKCADLKGKVDDIRIQLGGAGYHFGVPFEDYSIDFNAEDVDFCIIGIDVWDFDFYILGDSFLRSYLSIYDFEGSRVGLALHKYSNATIEPPKKPLNILVLVLVISLAFLFVLSVLYCSCRKRVSNSKKEQLPTDIQDDETMEKQSILHQPNES